MTYSLNGIPFDNPTYGWTLRSTSKPLANLAHELSSVPRQGRHGVLSPDPGVLGAPTIMLVVQTPRAQRQTLEAFVRKGGVLTSTYEPGQMVVEFASLSPTGHGDAEKIIDVAITFRVPEAAARGPEVTTAAVGLGSASVAVTGLFPGLGLEVQDAQIRVRGAFSGLQVTDSGGSWFTFPGPVAAGEYLLFVSEIGRAVIGTDPNSWDDYTKDVSGQIDYGGPRGLFEISPTWGADLAVRDGRLTVATATRTGASVQVRGRAAFLV